jgi:hypothetical protein
MPDLEEHELDRILPQHLAARLERHVGNAEAAFATHLSRTRRLRLTSACALAGAALAASVAAFVLFNPFRHTPPPSLSLNRPVPELLAASPATDVECTVFSRTFDDGTFVIGGDIPVRRLRREIVQTVEWFDPQQEAHIQVSLPREQVVLVGMRKY